MKPTLCSKNTIVQAVVLMMGSIGASSIMAADFYLRADTTTLTMPDGPVITMWGFAPADVAGTATGPVVIPGPALSVPAGDSTLTIHVFNALTVPVSIIIPGQRALMTPTMFTDSQGRQRVRSFTHETAPGFSGSYAWTNLQPGTYLYQSGTHPAIQVQMGLYGSVTHDDVAGAYPGIVYNTEAILLYSEIDPALHAAVANGVFGTPAYPSTVNYAPKYFLINGNPQGDYSLTIGAVGTTTLLRFLNAGLTTRVPIALGLDMQLIAEDGRVYSHPHDQYSVLLAAGKTMDALITPAAAGVFAIQDRRINSNSVGSAASGTLASLVVSGAGGGSGPIPTNSAPVANNDAVHVAQGSTWQVPASGPLANDTDSDGDALTAQLVSPVLSGTATLQPSGAFTYRTPSSTFVGTEAFDYRAVDSTGRMSNVAAVTVIVDQNKLPVTRSDSATMTKRTLSNASSVKLNVLANDFDPDATASNPSGPANPAGTINPARVAIAAGPNKMGSAVVNPDGTITYTPKVGFVGTESFSYRIRDGLNARSLAAAVRISVTK